jgi:hypothetical protein
MDAPPTASAANEYRTPPSAAAAALPKLRTVATLQAPRTSAGLRAILADALSTVSYAALDARAPSRSCSSNLKPASEAEACGPADASGLSLSCVDSLEAARAERTREYARAHFRALKQAESARDSPDEDQEAPAEVGTEQ